MCKERLIEAYKKGYLAIKDIPTVIVEHDIEATCNNYKYHIKKGESCIGASLDILGRYLYLMDMIDDAIKKQIISIDELIKITEEFN